MASYNAIETKVRRSQVESVLKIGRGGKKVIVNNPMLFGLTVFCKHHEVWGTHTVGGYLDFCLNSQIEDSLGIVTLLDAYQDKVLHGVNQGLALDGIASEFVANGYLDLGCGRWLHTGCGKIIYRSNEYVFNLETPSDPARYEKAIDLIFNEVVLCVKALTAGAWYFSQLHRNPAYLKANGVSAAHGSDMVAIDPLISEFIDRTATGEVQHASKTTARLMRIGDLALNNEASTVH
jgi:hypothetical protein